MLDAAPTRPARAVAMASASFGLGTAGHVLAGGHATSPAGLLVAGGFCALAGAGYSRRRRSGPATTALLLANQLVLHVGLAWSSSAAAMGPLGDPSCHERAPLGAVPGGHLHAAAMPVLPDGWMLLAHLLATLLTVAILVVVEASYLACVALVQWLLRLVLIALRQPLIRYPSSCPPAYRLPTWRSRPIVTRSGRGPPALHLA